MYRVYTIIKVFILKNWCFERNYNMVDPIIIDEAGSAKTSVSNPVWARESTLQSIYSKSSSSTAYLQALSKTTLSDKEFTKANAEALKVAKTGISSTFDNFKGLDFTLKHGFSDLSDGMSGTFKTLTQTFSSIGRDGILGHLSSTASVASKTLAGISEGSTGLMAVMTSLPAVLLEFSVGVFEAYKVTKELTDDFQKLYENGINFNSGLEGMLKASGDLGISTDELVSSFNQFSTSVTYFGTNRITKLAKQFTDLNRTSGDLGLTNAEATDVLLQYTDMLRVTNTVGNQTNDDLVKGAAAYAQELNLLANLTGRSRKEQQKEAEERRKNLDLNLSISNLPQEVQKRILDSTVELNKLGPTMGDVFTKALASEFAGKGLAGLDRTTQILLTQSGLDKIIPQMAKDAKLTGNITKDVGNALNIISNPQAIMKLRMMANGQGEVADAAREMIRAQQESANASKQENDIRNEVNKTLKDQNNTLSKDEIEKKIRARIQKDSDDKARDYIKTQNALDKVSASLYTSFNNLLVKGVQPLLPYIEKLANVTGDLLSGFATALNVFGTGFTTIFDVLTNPAKNLSNALSSIRIGFDKLLRMFGFKFTDSDSDGDSGGDHDRHRTGNVEVKSILSQMNLTQLLGSAASITALSVIATKLIMRNSFVKALGSIIKTPAMGAGNMIGNGISSVWQKVRGTGAIGEATDMLGAPDPTKIGSLKSPSLLKRLSNKLLGKTAKGLGGAASEAASKLGTASNIEKVTEDLGEAEKGVTSKLGSMGSSIGGALKSFGSALVEGSAGLMKILTNLGKGIGGAIGGVLGESLKGLAVGLESFKNPAILEGATIFAGSIAIIGGISSFAISLLARSLPELGIGLRNLTHVDGDKLLSVGAGMKAVGEGLFAMGKSEVLTAFGGLMDKVFSFFGVKNDPIEKFKRFGELAEPLSTVAPVMKVFADAWTQALTALNGAKIDDSITKTINDLSNILFIDNKAGYWSGKVTTASKVQELADSIGSLAAKTAELQNAQSGATTSAGVKLLSPSDLQKRTIGFYDDQKQSNAVLIQLLQMVNGKLDVLNTTTENGADKIVNSVGKHGGRVY